MEGADSEEFHRCAVSLVPAKTPVASPDGVVFDMMNIMPLLRDKPVNPVTGEVLTPRDLISLRFHRNAKGLYADPVSERQLTDAMKIVVLRPSGRVYEARTINDVCVATGDWHDPVSGEAFSAGDVIVLHDPLAQRKKRKQPPATATSTKEQKTKKKKKKKKPKTASAAAVVEDDRPARLRLYRAVRADNNAKALCRMETNVGMLRIALHCNLAPETCHNFVLLAQRRYFDDMAFHRLIAGFMIQGGDPTGTGRGGESAWGKEPFPDEVSTALRHDRRGIVSMANAGPDTNGSQFFVTFAPCPHLDGKHTVFGQVIEDEEGALDRMERAAHAKDIVMSRVVVDDHPFVEQQPDAKHAAMPAAGAFREGQGWLSAPRAPADADESQIGRYVPAAARLHTSPAPAGGKKTHKDSKKRKKGSNAGGSWGAFG